MKTCLYLCKKIFFFLVFLWCINSCVYGQHQVLKVPDSLKENTYIDLYNKYKKHISDTARSTLYLNTFLSKATNENNSINKALALNELSYYADNKRDKLALIKQSLSESNRVDSIHSIPAYNNLGLYYQDYYEYGNALEQYLKVVSLAQKGNDNVYEGIALNNIAKLRTAIGDYDEALILYKRGYELKKKQGDISEETIVITSLELAESYRYNKKYDSASYYYDEVIALVKEKYPYVLSTAKINEGINKYYKGDYKQAQQLLEEGISLINLNSSYYLKYYIRAQFYLAKMSESLDKERSISYYQRIDSLLTKVAIVIPEVRETYEFLEFNYEKNNDYVGQLYAINKLLKFDSITTARKINTSYKINTEFDTPELLRSKEVLIEKLESKNHNLNLNFILLLIGMVITLIGIVMQYRRHKIYKKRFEKLLDTLNNKTIEISNIEVEKVSRNLNIDPEIISSILNKLQAFELKNDFLKKTITITSLAKKLSTNTKYLSNVINTYKGKTFVQYINDLRIEYILQELKVNPKLHHYTILSIAKEASFNSVNSFTTAFRKKTGISPSYYIKNLKSKQKDDI
ncbi:tetratricopeptide repeat protein [uncultured Dokdonia sp.]|uniref:tetratricopeptide repeat protein n=1 Tax=uncultured Dokdonia sp. TaxID=575653 RepID=UPI00261C9D0D|nr:tetratricopeptide repeat protein [uncultured Dokdonia sp.]